MSRSRDILVTTASTIEGYKILNHLKPVSANVVAGTNLFSDFFASFSDVFGGRSNSYQKQLEAIYQEVIEKLKISAFEIGANSIIGLKVDIDEISGKGKSMFMVTAMGTAVISDYNENNVNKDTAKPKPQTVSIENVKILQRKREIINQATSNNLKLDEDIWNFITTNRVSEIYEFIIDHLRMLKEKKSEAFPTSYDLTLNYLDSFPDDIKSQLVYESIIKELNYELIDNLCEIVNKFHLLDFYYIKQIIESADFKKQKLALKLLRFDKFYYNKEDVEQLQSFRSLIEDKFQEKGTYTSKKGLFSSKEKDVWVCECKTTNEINSFCKNCFKDIYGFTAHETSPPVAIKAIEEKISLISELI